jgi:beta-N-acetylhexosaminidase
VNGRQLIMGFVLVVFSGFCFGETIVRQDNARQVKLTEEGQEWAEQTLRELSLEMKVGQMIQVRYFADYKNFDSYEYRYVRAELQRYYIGSVVFGMHFNNSGPIRSSPMEAARVANQLQRDAKLPLLLAADFERGVASRLNDVPAFPWPMAFGAVDDPKEVERFAVITGKEARAIGVQWALAPVADLNSNPANPIINTRSFGEDPKDVGSLVEAFIRGAHAGALLVTAKHFPGNGDTSVDSHRAVAYVESDLDHLEKVEFPPFERAISAGVDSILLAHARVLALEPDPEKITTISAKVVEGTLKDRLGFKGVVLTDALEMQGLTRLYDPQKGSPTARAAVDAVKAGCDVIMVPTDLDGAFRAIIEAVRRGEISESRIDESVRKILEMKAMVGLHKSRFVDLDQVAALTSKPKDIEFAQHVADQAVTLVRDSGRILPLQRSANPAQHRLVAILDAMALESGNGHEFEKALRSRRPDAVVYFFDGRFSSGQIPEILKAVNEADQVIVVAYAVHGGTRQANVNGAVLSSFGLVGSSRQLLRQVLAAASEKTAVIALGSPYLIEDFPQIQTYICTYAMATTSEISAVKALFGEIQNHAKLPVTLPGIATRGFSLPWPKERVQAILSSIDP